MRLYGAMAHITKVSKATTNSKSIRTTIPEDLAEQMGLAIQDTLVWKLDKENGKEILKIRKVDDDEFF